MQDIHDRINVYRLVAPGDIVEQQDGIAQAFFGIGSAHDGNRILTISPISGRLSYTDTGRIWQNKSPAGLPISASEAQQVAEEFLRKARTRLIESQTRAKVNLSQLIPSQLHHVLTTAARNPGQPFIDHWLSIFAPTLPTGRSKPDNAPVDAKIELRIGPNRQPVGMLSSWRPFDSFRSVGHIDFPGEPDTADLFYRMADSEDPQTFIAPFYLTTTGDDTGTLWPASRFSLLADIVKQETPSGVTLTATTPPAIPGPFSYAWGAWRLDNPDVGFRMLATGQQQVQLTEVGSYNIVLDVEDQKTGAIARTQSVVFVSKPQEQLVS